MTIYEERDCVAYKDGSKRDFRHPVVKEAPLTILVDGRKLATLVCSPFFHDLLAVGHLVSEGILRSRDELQDVVCDPEQGVVRVNTVSGSPRTDGRPVRPVRRGSGFTVKEVTDLAALLEAEAVTFKLTGGVHEAALAHKGGFVVRYEDIGRHNALDRILGYTFLNDVDTSDKAVLLSGRIASEMLLKAARIGVPVVISRSAPTCLSIDQAERLGITLVAFARGDGLNIYTHPGRIAG